MFASTLRSDQRYRQMFASGHCTLVSKKETLDDLGEGDLLRNREDQERLWGAELQRRVSVVQKSGSL
ncbi:hypothetical protein AAC387_Pa02g3195 [Persea americana]